MIITNIEISMLDQVLCGFLKYIFFFIHQNSDEHVKQL